MSKCFHIYLYMHVITPIHSKRYIRRYRMRVYIFNRLVWLNMIYYAVRKMEIDIPERDIQSKSPSDCSIDLCSILWLYCRLWFIVSDDEIIDFERINIFHWKTVIFTAVLTSIYCCINYAWCQDYDVTIPVIDLPSWESRYSGWTVSLQYHCNNLTLCVIMIAFIHVIVFSHLFVYIWYHIHLQ